MINLTSLQQTYLDGLVKKGGKHGWARDRRVLDALVRKGFAIVKVYPEGPHRNWYTVTVEGEANTTNAKLIARFRAIAAVRQSRGDETL